MRRRLFWGAEAVFAVTFAIGVLLASLAPDVWNTEKPMDMAFITALNASDHFPPHDPWMSGETLNYYYLGHLALAWPIKLLGLRPDSGYLLAWGLLLALTATAVYTFSGTLWAAARETLAERAPRGGPVFAGLVAAALVAILGQPRRRADVAARRRPAGRLRVVRAVAGDPGHDQRVPVVLVPARGPARARAGAAVHGAGAGVRDAGRAVRPARRSAVAGGGGGVRRGAGGRDRCGRSTRGRIRSPRACWRPRSWSGCATAGRAASRWSGSGSCSWRASC